MSAHEEALEALRRLAKSATYGEDQTSHTYARKLVAAIERAFVRPPASATIAQAPEPGLVDSPYHRRLATEASAGADARLGALVQAFLEKYDAAEPFVENVYRIAHAHGHRYAGPSYEVELAELRRALSGRAPTPDSAVNPGGPEPR